MSMGNLLELHAGARPRIIEVSRGPQSVFGGGMVYRFGFPND